MERNVMGELNVYRGAGAKPNFSDIARRHGMDRHTVAKYWSGGEPPRSEVREGERLRPVGEIAAEKAQLPGMTKRAVYEFLLDGRGDPPLPGYGAFTAWCRARDVPFGGVAAASRTRGSRRPRAGSCSSTGRRA